MPAQAQTSDASAAYRIESGRTGFLGGGTLGRPPLKVRWRKALGSSLTAPILVGDRVYASYVAPGASGSEVVALDATTGGVAWTRSFSGYSKLAYEAGRLVVLTSGGGVTALDAANGLTKWTRQLMEPFDFYTSPVVRDGLVYVGMAWSGGAMWAMRLSDGEMAFITGYYYAGAPTVRGGLAFQSTGCATTAVDAKTGARAWDTYQSCTSYEGWAATAGGHVVTSGGFVLEGATGKLLSTFSPGSAAAIAGDVLVHLDGELLRARSLTTGLDLWSVRGTFSSAPVIVDQVVYLGLRSNEMVGLDLSSGAELWRHQIAPAPDYYDPYGYGPGVAGVAAGAGMLAVPVGGELVVYESAAPSLGAGTRVVSGPEGPQRSRSATFEIASPLPTQCRLDGGTWAPCTGSVSYPLLAEGSHAFEVRGTDPAGKPLALAYRSFAIDATAPTTTLKSTPPKLTSYRYRSSFSFETVGASGTECRLDGGEWTKCTSPAEYGELPDGEHVFRVRSYDFVGNVEDPPQEYRWTLDSVGPVVTVTSKPPAWSNSRDASVSFEVSEQATVTCQLSGRSAQPCSSPVEYHDLPDGSYSLSISAVDKAGNNGYTSVTWVVDNEPPETVVAGGSPSGTTNDRQPAFYFGSSDYYATYECRVDSDPFEECGQGWRPAALADGPHTFRVRSTDGAGNIDPTPATRDFNVDTGSPQVIVDSAPPANTKSREASIAFHTTEASAVTCSWDGGIASACSSPASRSGLADGYHTLYIQARDDAGNTGAATVGWTVDTAGPDTQIDSAPPSRGRDRQVTFAFSGAGATAFECRIGSGAWSNCSSPWTSPELADGTYQFAVRGYDGSGTPDASPASYQFTIDNEPPVIVVHSAPEKRTASSQATVDFSATGSTTCSWDNGEHTSCSGPVHRFGLADGPHALSIVARDLAGNEASAYVAWVVDTQAPDTAIDTGPAATIAQRRPTFTFSSGPDAAAFQCSVDGGAWFSCGSPWTSGDLADGQHGFRVRALDDVGNADASPAARTFTVDADTKPPATQPPTTQPPASPASPASPGDPVTPGTPQLPAAPTGHWVIDPGSRGWPVSAAALAEVLDAWLGAQRGSTLVRRARFAIPYVEARPGSLTITITGGGKVVARGRATVSGYLTWGRFAVVEAQRARLRRARKVTVEVVFRPARGAAVRARRSATLKR